MASNGAAATRRRWGIGLAVVALLAAVVAMNGRRGGALVGGDGAAAAVAAAAPSTVARARPSIAAAGARAFAPASAEAAMLPPPASFRGTSVDGDLTLDEQGRFVATAAARQLFDYFLTADGEEAPAAIRARVAAEAARRLPGPEAQTALALFDRYLEYRDRLAASMSAAPRGDALAVLAASEALQRELFGAADADRLFGDDDRLARSLLERAGAAATDRAPP